MHNIICKFCKISFSHRKKDRKHCSPICRQKHKILLKTAVCKFCNKNFLKNSTTEQRNYCSKSCSNSATKRNRIAVSCTFCSKEFEKHPGDLGKTGNFCSVKCSQFFKRNGNDAKITKICPNCDVKFVTPYNSILQRKHCSQKCALKKLHQNTFDKNRKFK